MRTGVDLVFFIVWASVGVLALGVWFVATLRLSRRRVRAADRAPARSTASASTPATVSVPV